MAPRRVHPLVKALAKGSKAPRVADKGLAQGSAGAFAYASDLPETVLFSGFLGDVVEQPDGEMWQVLYLDLELTECLLVKEDGILECDQIPDKAVPCEQVRDVIWVKADAAVGRGPTSQSVEALFLTGEFTRAAEFDAPPTGEMLRGTTGVFCEARTPSCCRRKTLRP